LGGAPNFNPEGLATRSHAQYVEGATLERMIREDLVAERVAIEIYSEITRWLGSDDPTTRRLIEDILKMEEEHADDLANLLQTLASRPAKARTGNGAARRRARRRSASVPTDRTS
jgi:bacterioferritin